MRRTLWATTASTLAASLVIGLSACSDSTNPSGGATISASETNDIGEAEADEVDQSVGSLTADGAVAAVARGAVSVLAAGGGVVLEVGAGQAKTTADLLEELGLHDVRVTPDLRGIGRVVEGVWQ